MFCFPVLLFCQQLPRTWGHLVSEVVETGGILGLILLRGAPLNPKTSSHVCKVLINSSEMDHHMVPLRWSARHLLVSFDTVETYTTWGNQLLEERLDVGDTHQVVALEPAIFCSIPKAVVCVSSQGHDLVASLANPIMSFSSKFTYMHIILDTEATVAHPTDNDSIPHLCLVLMFDGRNQIFALRTLEKLAASPWKPVMLTSEVTRVLDPGSEFFQNDLGGPVIGVNTGCPQSGVRIMVFTKSADSFESMVQFYGALLGVDAVSRSIKSANTSYSIFPLSARSELMVAYLDGVKVSMDSDLDLYVKVNDLSQINVEEMEGGSCRLKDPDWNSVIAFTTDLKE